jgi:hypothetical protein
VEVVQVKKMSVKVLSLLVVAAGCGKTIPPDEVVPLDKVPPAIMKKAKDTLPGYTITAVYRKIENGKDVYELRGKNREGRTREVEITPEGEIAAVE